MRKNKRIWIIISAALILILLLVFIWQFPNISNYMQELDYGSASVQEADSSVTDTQEQPKVTQMQQSTSEMPGMTTAQPSEETSEMAEETLQESAEGTTQNTVQPSEIVTKPSETVTQPTQEQEDSQTRINELIAMVYALKDEYTSRLQQIEQAGINEYNALPEEEQTQEKKKEIALSCVDEAYALEKECDGRIDEICMELGILLIQTNGDMTLINEIRYVYASEKAAAKNELTERYSALLG